MQLSEKLTHRHLTVVALAVGMSFPIYAMAEMPADMAMSTKVVTQTSTTVVKHNHHHAHMAMHKSMHRSMHKAAENHEDAVTNAKALDAHALNAVDAAQDGGTAAQSDASQDTMKRVIWKNGVIYHEVEPTGQAGNGAFGVPASTSDTLQGGVTPTTVTH
jgi:hypothetical protein